MLANHGKGGDSALAAEGCILQALMLAARAE